MDEIVNDANIAMENDVNEVQRNEKVKSRSEQIDGTYTDIIKDKGKRVIADS